MMEAYKEYIAENCENKRIMLVTDIHYCDNVFHGKGNDERMKNLIADIKTEYEENPFDMILCLGDYSLDFWAYEPYGSYLWKPPVSNTENFMKEIYPEFPVNTYMIPGNHEQYGNEKWKEITGFPRQFAVKYADCVFLMLDTFGGKLDPEENSDGTYTGIDADFLVHSLEKYKTERIIICAHDIIPEKENTEVRKIIRENDRIVCAFAGHIHSSKAVLLGDELRNLPVFYCGDYSYCADCNEKPNYGFRILDLNDGFSTVYRKKEH